MGGYRYSGIKFVSKLVWVYSDLKLDHHFGQFSIPKRFTKELVLRQSLPLQFFPAQELTNIKIWLSTDEDLYLGYHLLKFHNLCQNPYRFRSTLSFNLELFFRLSDSR